MKKTRKLTLINTVNVFVLGPLKRIWIWVLKLHSFCWPHNNGKYSQYFSTWPFQNKKNSQVNFDNYSQFFVLGPLKRKKILPIWVWNSTSAFVDCTTTVNTANIFKLKWQCRLIFESKSWKKFKVNNHHSGVTYGCTDQHGTIENFFFQSLPLHLADTVENVKNQL